MLKFYNLDRFQPQKHSNTFDCWNMSQMVYNLNLYYSIVVDNNRNEQTNQRKITTTETVPGREISVQPFYNIIEFDTCTVYTTERCHNTTTTVGEENNHKRKFFQWFCVSLCQFLGVRGQRCIIYVLGEGSPPPTNKKKRVPLRICIFYMTLT